VHPLFSTGCRSRDGEESWSAGLRRRRIFGRRQRRPVVGHRRLKGLGGERRPCVLDYHDVRAGRRRAAFAEGDQIGVRDRIPLCSETLKVRPVPSSSSIVSRCLPLLARFTIRSCGIGTRSPPVSTREIEGGRCRSASRGRSPSCSEKIPLAAYAALQRIVRRVLSRGDLSTQRPGICADRGDPRHWPLVPVRMPRAAALPTIRRLVLSAAPITSRLLPG
jgi:hypothetical protein